MKAKRPPRFLHSRRGGHWPGEPAWTGFHRNISFKASRQASGDVDPPWPAFSLKVSGIGPKEDLMRRFLVRNLLDQRNVITPW